MNSNFDIFIIDDLYTLCPKHQPYRSDAENDEELCWQDIGRTAFDQLFKGEKATRTEQYSALIALIPSRAVCTRGRFGSHRDMAFEA